MIPTSLRFFPPLDTLPPLSSESRGSRVEALWGYLINLAPYRPLHHLHIPPQSLLNCPSMPVVKSPCLIPTTSLTKWNSNWIGVNNIIERERKTICHVILQWLWFLRSFPYSEYARKCRGRFSISEIGYDMNLGQFLEILQEIETKMSLNMPLIL